MINKGILPTSSKLAIKRFTIGAKLVLLLIGLLFCQISYAATTTYDWTGAFGDGNWTTPQNWNVGGTQQTNSYPGKTGTTDAVQFGVTASTLTIGATLGSSLNTIGSLTFGPNVPSGLIILTVSASTGLTVSGALTLNSGSETVNIYNSSTAGITIKGAYNNAIGTTLNFTGSGPVTFGATFTNNGNTTFGSGSTVAFTATTNTFIQSAPTYPVIFPNLKFGAGSHLNFKSTSGSGNTAVFCLASTGVMTLGGTISNPSVINVSNSAFTLLSDANGSASVDVIPVGSQIVNIINVQRFITGTTNGHGDPNYRCYRALCSPVNASGVTPASTNVTSIAYLNQTNTIGSTPYYGAATGGPGGGFTFAINNPTIYLYNETLPVNNNYYISGKYYGVTAISGNTITTISNATGPTVTPTVSLPVGNGFLLFYIGSTQNRASGMPSIVPSDATPTATGYLNQGTIPVNLWYTPTGGTTGQLSYTSTLNSTQGGGAGYNLVGNPYACTINLQSVLNDNYNNGNGVDNIYTLAPSGASQTFLAYTQNGASSPLAQGFAISGEGFIAHVNNTGQTLTFKESQKAASQHISAIVMGKPIADPALTGLYLKLQKDSLHFDYCGIYFRGDWSARFEPGDAADVNGNIASLSSDGVHAAVNHMPDYFKGSRMRLFVGSKTGGNYTIKIEGIRNIDTLYDIYLIDRYKKDSVNIRKTGAYAFSILKSDTASFGENRFVLDVRRNPAYAYHLLDFAADRVGHSSHVMLTWRTQYEENSTNFTVERSNDGGKTFSIVGGMGSTSAGAYGLTDKNAMDGQNLYRLKSEDISNNITYSLPAEVTISGNSDAGAIRLYPNPATSIVNLDLLDKANGNSSYSITVSNNTGLIVKQVTSSQPKWQADISNLMPGTYLVRVINTKTQSFVGETKFVKL